MNDRNIGEELIQAAREMKANQHARVTQVNDVMITRQKLGLSQAAFARMLGISPRTIQEWEKGRRRPQGAALSLLRIAQAKPDIVREVLASLDFDTFIT